MRNIYLLGVVVLLAVSCRSGVKGRELSELSASEKTTDAYVVGSGDTLNVLVWGEPKLSGEVVVREDGKLTLSLIEDVGAEGKTLSELAREIEQKLMTYVAQPSVSVSLAHAAPIKYFLSGAFVKPGEYRSEGQIDFLRAVATGGGFAPFANESSIVLIRKTKQGEFRYEFDYNRVIQGKEPNPILRNGDLIAVR